MQCYKIILCVIIVNGLLFLTGCASFYRTENSLIECTKLKETCKNTYQQWAMNGTEIGCACW